jgi:hypothetical protein
MTLEVITYFGHKSDRMVSLTTLQSLIGWSLYESLFRLDGTAKRTIEIQTCYQLVVSNNSSASSIASVDSPACI